MFEWSRNTAAARPAWRWTFWLLTAPFGPRRVRRRMRTLLRWLQTRRACPVVDVGGGFGLTGLLQKTLTLLTGRQMLCLFPSQPGLFNQPLAYRFVLFEPEALHDGFPP